MASQSPIHIVCAADRAFLRHVPTMLASVRAHTSAPLKASVFSVGWRPVDQLRLRAATPGVALNFVSLSTASLAGLPFKEVLSPLSYARILMPDLVDDDRILYLDVDMIVRADVTELWAIDLGNAPAAAVFHNNGASLNSGLILVNCKVWRALGLGGMILDWARCHQPKEGDQDAIEAVLGAEMLRLDPRWNRLVDPIWGRSILWHAGYREDAAVLHFITGFKPWNLGRWLLPRAYAAEWKKHKKRTGLPFDWSYEIKTVMWQVRILLLHALFR